VMRRAAMSPSSRRRISTETGYTPSTPSGTHVAQLPTSALNATLTKPVESGSPTATVLIVTAEPSRTPLIESLSAARSRTR
jgi:hypothetical protein